MKRLLAGLILLLACSVSAWATEITVQSHTKAGYQYTDASPKIRVYVSQAFLSSTGEAVPASAVGSANWYRIINCTANLSTDILTIPALTLPSTTDASPNSARYTLVLYTGNTRREIVYSNMKVPTAYGTTITIAQWITDNQLAPTTPKPGFPDVIQVQTLINAASGLIPEASTSVKGKAQFATDGESTALEAVQANDTRLSNSRAPNGVASGDLQGTYPSPTLAPIVESKFSFSDNVTANASSTKHGLLPKLSGNATDFLTGAGTFALLNKAAVGLTDADDTSDANKPVSTAQQSALDAKPSLSGSANQILFYTNSTTATGITGATTDGSEVTLNAPNITNGLYGSTGSMLSFVSNGSPVNLVTINNAATGSSPGFIASGADTNIDLRLRPKGTGKVDLGVSAYNNCTVLSSASGLVTCDGSLDNDPALTANSSTKIPTQQAVKSLVANAALGLQFKDPVAVATTVNITLSGEQTIDAVLTSTNRVLAKNQTAATENGIYVSGAGAWARATDADSDAELLHATMRVTAGSTQAGDTWTNNNAAITIGATDVTFAQLSDSTSVTGDGTSVDVIANVVGVKALGITNAMLAGSIGDDKLSANIPLKDSTNIFSGANTFTNPEFQTASGVALRMEDSGSGNGINLALPSGLASYKLVYPASNGGAGTWCVQSVSTGSTVATLSFVNCASLAGAGTLTFNAPSPSNITVPATGTLATLAGAETLTNKVALGIGTASPAYPVHVVKNYNGPTTVVAFNTTDGTLAQVSGGASRTSDFTDKFITWGVTAPLFSGAGYGETAYLHAKGVPIKLGTLSANDVYVFTNGIANPRLAVTSGGSVGVGDTTPDHALDVEGNIGIAASGYLNFGDTDGTSGYGLRDNAGTVEFKNSGGAWAALGSGGGGGAVSSVFGRTGTVVAATNDYTWAQIDKTTSSLANLTTRSATDLTSGTLPDARFPATFPVASGANLTNLNAANLTGIVSPDRVAASHSALQVVRVNAANNALEFFTLGSGAGDVVGANNGTDFANLATTFNNLKQPASLTTSGVTYLTERVISEFSNNFTTAIDTIGSTPTTLAINDAATAGSTRTVPATLTIRWTGAGSLSVASGVVITMATAKIIADPQQQIFIASNTNTGAAGTGKVRFTGETPALSVKWWGAKGDGSTDDTVSVKAALAAVDANISGEDPALYKRGAVLEFPVPSVYYLLSSTIDVYRPMHIRGTGSSSGTNAFTTRLTWNAATTGFRFHRFNTLPGFTGTQSDGAILQGLELVGTVSASTGTANVSGLTVTRVTGPDFDDDFNKDYVITVNGWEYVVATLTNANSLAVHKPRLRVAATNGSPTVTLAVDWTPNMPTGDWNGQAIKIDGVTYTISSHTASTITLTGNFTGTTATSADAQVQTVAALSGVATTLNKFHGVDSYAQISIRDVLVRNFSGQGYNFDTGTIPSCCPAATNTNTNNSQLERVMSAHNRGHGILTRGLNSNNIIAENLDLQDNRGAGILDTSFLGNAWGAPHSASNRFAATFSNADINQSTYNAMYTEDGQPSSVGSQFSLTLSGDQGAGWSRPNMGYTYEAARLYGDASAYIRATALRVIRQSGDDDGTNPTVSTSTYIGEKVPAYSTFLAIGTGDDTASNGGNFTPALPGFAYRLQYCKSGSALGAGWFSWGYNDPTCADATKQVLAMSGSAASGGAAKLQFPNGFTVGSGGTAVNKILSATASLNFTALAANTCEVLTVALTGVVDGDSISLGIPDALADVDGATESTTFFAWASGSNVVSVRRCNVTGTITGDPAAATVRVSAVKF